MGRTCPGKQELDAGLFHKNVGEAGGGYHMVLVGDEADVLGTQSLGDCLW